MQIATNVEQRGFQFDTLYDKVKGRNEKDLEQTPNTALYTHCIEFVKKREIVLVVVLKWFQLVCLVSLKCK
jgi:hypothetical protein